MADLMISEGPHKVIVERPDAPYDLDDEESSEWRAIVNAMPPNHFARSHYPMLTQLCRHVVASRHIGQLIAIECRKKKLDRREYAALLHMQSIETGMIVKLERSMRLTQMSSINQTAIKKLRPLPTLIDAPWNRQDEDGDDDQG
jgi:hypothetical protein